MMTDYNYTEQALAEKIDAEGGIGGMINYGWPGPDELPANLPEDVRHAFANVEEVLLDMQVIEDWVYSMLDSW